MERKPVISRDLAEQIADHVASLGYNSPFSTVLDDGVSRTEQRTDSRGHTYKHFVPVHEGLDFSAFGALPEGWASDVHQTLSDRLAARVRAELGAAIEAFETTPAIKAHLGRLFAQSERGLRKPERADLTGMARLAARDLTREVVLPSGRRTRIGKPAYRPKDGCKARLKLKEAVFCLSTQESYADHTEYAIPVEIEEGADMAVCHQNLHHFAECLGTHDGTAGSGSTWGASLVVTPEGAYVALNGRHSISD
jgi:hypothetical protein